LKLNVIGNWKFASRCQIASGLYGPSHVQFLLRFSSSDGCERVDKLE
jgi:hypothetical protein